MWTGFNTSKKPQIKNDLLSVFSRKGMEMQDMKRGHAQSDPGSEGRI